MRVLSSITFLLILFNSPAASQTWRVLQRGLSVTEVDLRAGRMRIPVRVVVARIDPARFYLSLEQLTKANRMSGAWNVDSTANDVAISFNAGQFKETGPWGWLVIDSHEQRDPGYGPLSIGIALDSAGRVRWITPDQLGAARSDRSIRFAFQSYPLLLRNGRTPQLLTSSDEVDRDHRDARLILGEAGDGSLLVALTRFALGERVPIGLTIPESIKLMKNLGARHAVMLDGGISAQLLLRDSTGAVRRWKGLRDVPVALVARPRLR